jgi:DNA-binding GntR family transcriptional regulator
MLAGNPAVEGDQPPHLDNRLHDYLIEKSENRYIQIFFGQHTATFFMSAFDHAAPEAHVVAEMAAQHRAILEALIARRWGRARGALVQHIRAQKPILMRILRAGTSEPRPAGGR